MPAAASKSQNPANDNLWLRVAEAERTTQPINTQAPLLSTQNDSLIASQKAGAWLLELERTIGQPGFDKSMRGYLAQWQFKHVTPKDFKKNIDSVSEKKLQPLFEQLNNNH